MNCKYNNKSIRYITKVNNIGEAKETGQSGRDLSISSSCVVRSLESNILDDPHQIY